MTKNFGRLSHEFAYGDKCNSRKFEELPNYHYKNMDTKLTLTLLSQLYISLENAKVDGATTFYLNWIEKYLTCARNTTSNVVLIRNQLRFYAPIVSLDSCALILLCLLHLK